MVQLKTKTLFIIEKNNKSEWKTGSCWFHGISGSEAADYLISGTTCTALLQPVCEHWTPECTETKTGDPGGGVLSDSPQGQTVQCLQK